MPDSTSLFLKSRGVSPKSFWDRANARVRTGWDQVLAWLDLFLEEVRPGGALAGVSETDLADFGATLDSTFYPGVRELLTELRTLVAGFGVEIEYYIVSGGPGNDFSADTRVASPQPSTAKLAAMAPGRTCAAELGKALLRSQNRLSCACSGERPDMLYVGKF